MKHLHFIPKKNIPVSLPPDENSSDRNTMKVFIPVNVDHNSTNISVKYRKAYSNIYLIQIIINCNVNGGYPKNIKFCCINIKNAYFRTQNDINMIMINAKIKNDSRIHGGNPAKFKLHDYPEWNIDPITFHIDENKKLFLEDNSIDSQDTYIEEDPNLVLYSSKFDSCTIPPKG